MTKTQVAEILWGWRPGPRRYPTRRSATLEAGPDFRERRRQLRHRDPTRGAPAAVGPAEVDHA
jgi:hypothetical protein